MRRPPGHAWAVKGRGRPHASSVRGSAGGCACTGASASSAVLRTRACTVKNVRSSALGWRRGHRRTCRTLEGLDSFAVVVASAARRGYRPLLRRRRRCGNGAHERRKGRIATTTAPSAVNLQHHIIICVTTTARSRFSWRPSRSGTRRARTEPRRDRRSSAGPSPRPADDDERAGRALLEWRRRGQ